MFTTFSSDFGVDAFDWTYRPCYNSNYSKPEENYKTLYGLVLLRKLLGRVTKRTAKGIIFKPLLREVTYKILPALQIIQRSFRYRWHYWLKSHPICCFFSLYLDKFPLAPVQTSGTDRNLTLDWFLGFSSRKSWWLLNFCRHNLE